MYKWGPICTPVATVAGSTAWHSNLWFSSGLLPLLLEHCHPFNGHVSLLTLDVVAVVVAIADRGDGGCPQVVAVIMHIDELGGCGSVPSLKVNKCHD